MRLTVITFFAFLLVFTSSGFSSVQPAGGIVYDTRDKTISISTPNKSLAMLIAYGNGVVIKKLTVKGKNTLATDGVYTGFSNSEGVWATSAASALVRLLKRPMGVTINGIDISVGGFSVSETWDLDLAGDQIIWKIQRQYHSAATLRDMAFPKWNFADMSTWKGGILDNGGMVWCKYLKEENDTYGVHTGGVTYWNEHSGDALAVQAVAGDGYQVATKFSNNGGLFTGTQLVTGKELGQNYGLSRFVHGKYDVFAPFNVDKGTVSVTIKLNYVDYVKTYSRGNLPGIDAVAVRELMNTTGRYGVVDNRIIGANGWLTNWKCLHEPFFAQIGLALNDPNYTRNFAATLDQERDQAILKDGRVLSRWHNTPGDEIPGTYNTRTGYYEAMWGYTIDSQPDQVINTAEQFNLSGDVNWLRSHQQSCEKALDWLIARDKNHNGIYEMMNDNIAQKKASDWLDIVWASYENAFVNAQLYEALNLWADCEKVLGSNAKAAYYSSVAARLKQAFNKPVADGGFWSEEKKQYVYWRDNDGSVHGDNLVTPVNFAVIAFNLCDDDRRKKLILDQIEERTAKEDLFHWPLCFDSFRQDEVSGGNWPFPKYENGDIFPTWGYLGVRAYSNYNVAIALKYIKKLLTQYRKDGLSSQRYSRTTQLGLGDDILAGICTSITALYSDIYGLRPKWDRLGLEPHLLTELKGTRFDHTLRGKRYQISLDPGSYQIVADGFWVQSRQAFGVGAVDEGVALYPDNKNDVMLYVRSGAVKNIGLKLDSYVKAKGLSWKMLSAGTYQFVIAGLKPGAVYRVNTGTLSKIIKAGNDGKLSFNADCKKAMPFAIKLG